MKKMLAILSLTVLMFLTFFITGCDKAPQNEIRRAELTVSERELLQAAGIDNCYVFDINLADKDFSSLRSWVEGYERGTLVKEELGIEVHPLSSHIGDSNNKFVITLREGSPMSKEYEYSVSFSTDRGLTKGRKVTIPKPEFAVSSVGFAEKQGIEPNKPTILAVSIFDKDGAIPEFITDNTYAGDENEIERILRNDFVYLFYCQFGK